jgi:hypothetical protein
VIDQPIAPITALKRGWHLGEPSFADKWRSLVEGNAAG